MQDGAYDGPGAPPPEVLPIVVAVALLDGSGRVLAAQRAHPPALAGRWELPGGKVAPGEAEVEALARECVEELDVEITIGPRLGEDLPTTDGAAVLRVYTATLRRRLPVAREHQALRWLAADELDSVGWLDADRPLLEPLAALLRSGRLP